MLEFPYHTLESAPDDAREPLDGALGTYGMVPNLYAKMAESPALLRGYLDLAAHFSRCGLGPVEQQVVLLTVSRVNGCGYCVGAHSVLADMGGVPADVTDAIRNDLPIADARLEALRQFAARLAKSRGWVSDAAIANFVDAGFSRADVLNVVLGVGLKTLSNYTNHLVDTQLDAAFANRAWQPPV